jgi:uncharacterized cupredoxin-like copper-binding protein
VNVLSAALLAAMMLTTPVEQTFVQGETLDYTVTWMKVTGGTARMTIAPVENDPPRFRITSVAKSSGGFARVFRIRDEIETIVSREDFSTLRFSKHLDEKGDKMHEVTTLEDGVATRVRQKVRKLPVPRPVLDPISVIYYCRTLDLTPGKSYELTLYADLKLYTVHARVLRRESITTPAGTFNTVVVEPQMIAGGVERQEKLLIWYSDDERHLPVRIRTEVKFGSVTATLKDVQASVKSVDPPPLPK